MAAKQRTKIDSKEGLWSKDTEVLTRKGWTACVAVGSEIATYDYRNGIISFEPVSEIFEREANPNEMLKVCLCNHSHMYVLGGVNIGAKNSINDKWEKLTAQEFYETNCWKRIPVSGTLIQEGLNLSMSQIEFLGLIFGHGDWDLKTDRVVIEVEKGTEASKEVDKHLKELKIKHKKLSYDGMTKGTRNKRPCKYDIWLCNMSDKNNKKQSEKLRDLSDFVRSEEIEKMNKKQFENFIRMYQPKDVNLQYTYIIMRHLNEDQTNKIQKLAVMNAHKAIAEPDSKGGYNVKLFKTESAVIGNKSDTEKMNWDEISADGIGLWAVETNGGGIVTRRDGRVSIIGGKIPVGVKVKNEE